MVRTFKGGMHLPDFKKPTASLPIMKIPADKVHIFPIKQHIGAQLSLKVKKGDEVTVGQVIADSDSFVSSPIKSSVSGVVTDIKTWIHPGLGRLTSVFVENDYKETLCNIEPKDPDKMTKEELLKAIRDAGIVGMGGAGFPTHVKLSPPEDKKIDTLIVNGAECEPFITADHRVMIEKTKEVVDGIRIVMKILGIESAYIGIETNKKDAIKAIKECVKDKNDIKVCPLKPKYPQGAEKQIIYAITKRRVPSGALPMDVGVVVINVDTAYQISDSIRTGMPLIKRVVTVCGDCIKNPVNMEVKCGTRFEYLINQAGGTLKEPSKIIMGGPMMGVAQYSIEAPVIKTTSSIIVLAENDDSFDDTSVCIRCAKCINNCPMKLSPMLLNRLCREGDFEKAEKNHILDCMECGLCSYLCPGKQTPLDMIRIGKQKIMKAMGENK